MKEIKLTQGKVALVDDEDYDRVSEFKWFYHSNGYARRSKYENKKTITIYLHVFILEAKWVDHIDGDGLNNQKSNLRICTNQQNQCNRRKTINTTSKFKGVMLSKKSRKFVASICINKKSIHLGVYALEIDAAKCYNEAAIKYFGEFAQLNIIE